MESDVIMFGNRGRVYVLVGLAVGIIIIGYGIREMMNPHLAEVTPRVEVVREETRSTDIVVAARSITRGQAIVKADLTSVHPSGVPPTNAETSVESVVGQFAIVEIPANSAILSSKISVDPAAAGLAAMVPVGYRAIEMRTTDEIAVGNFLRPGDHVDIALVLRETVLPKQTEARQIADGNPSESNTVLQDIRVLAVGDVLTGADAPAPQPETAGGHRPEPPHAVTLAMTPDQIGRYALASSLGVLQLSLRNPADLQTVSVGPVVLSDIRGVTPPSAAATNLGNRPIELIIGNKMRHIFSSNSDAKQ
jgi:pilus assembly protein CpaB